MKRLIALLLLVCVPATPAADGATLAVGGAAQTDVMVTVYNGNLGLVKDVRDTQFPAGIHEIQYADVASLIDPTSVHLKSLTDPAALRILEQNYDSARHLQPRALTERATTRVAELDGRNYRVRIGA